MNLIGLLVILASLFLLVHPAPLPDLTVDVQQVKNSLEVITRYFTTDSCEWDERCIEATGTRTLAVFDLTTPNIGDAPLNLGDPNENPDIFIWAQCHQHFHFETYANYTLERADHSIAAKGRKAAFCLGDWGGQTAAYNASLPWYDPNLVPDYYEYADCNGHQGISVGYQDTYGKELDCQWVDVTDVLAGDYFLRIAINEHQVLPEKNYDNNVFYIPLSIRCAEYEYAATPYAWTATPAATELAPLGPDGIVEIPLASPFRFACADHSSFFIHANGFLSWSNVDTDALVLGDRGTEPISNSIMAYYSNWATDPAAGGNGKITYQITGAAPNREIFINWEDVRHADLGEGNEVSFQLALTENSQNWQVNVRDSSVTGAIPVKTGICSTYETIDCTEYTGTALPSGFSLSADKKLTQVGSPTRPTASANGPYRGEVGQPIQFFGSGYDPDPNSNLTFMWTFGDGSVPVEEQNPTHVFERSGVFNVSVKASDGFQQSPPAWTKATITGDGGIGSSFSESSSYGYSVDSGSSTGTGTSHPIRPTGGSSSSSSDGGDGDGSDGRARSSAGRAQSSLFSVLQGMIQ